MERDKYRNPPTEEALCEFRFAPSHARESTAPGHIRDKQRQKNQAAIELLRSWRQGDEQEQQETLAYLKRALDEDRLSDRKHFS
jgi:hypothetical protein